MANLFVDHKDRWLSLAESDSDFAVLFIRLWIPFNAWYCNAYPHHKNADRPILEEMKIDNNLFRVRIVAHLDGNDSDSQQFKIFLGQLHIALERFYIPDADNRISFRNLKYRVNPVTSFSPARPIRNLNYKAEILTSGQVNAVIIEASPPNTSKFSYNHNKYDLNHFLTYPDYTRLNTEQQAAILNCFREINPKKAEDLTTNVRASSINCGGILFKNNTGLLSQAIIELLYKMRCILFHGEIQPSKDNLSNYEPAYYILRMLLKSLK